MSIPCNSCHARNSPLCSVFTDIEIEDLFSLAHIRRIGAGEYLLHEEDPVRQVYNISSGALALERLSSNGAKQIMAFCYAGDFIGIASGRSYSVSARSLKPLTACQWQETDLQSLYKKYPKLETRVHEITSRVVEAIMDQLFVLGRKKATEKIAWFLLFIETRQANASGNTSGHAERFDASSFDVPPFRMPQFSMPQFNMPMTRVDIADYLGLTVETVSRAFTQLKTKGLIDITDKWTITIKDRAALTALGDYSSPAPGRKG